MHYPAREFTETELHYPVVTGLELAKHNGPSSVGIDTLIKSQGKIPEIFLRGCGVPDAWIEYIPSLIAAMKPIQFYSCFISYSAADTPFAERLHADLQSNGVRCWFAPKNLKIGDKFREKIDESIHTQDRLMLVLSKKSIQSDWVETEVEAAMEKERREKRPVLFPIRLDDAVMKTEVAWAAHIRRSRHIGDFTRWKEDASYMEAFKKLLDDLKTAE